MADKEDKATTIEGTPTMVLLPARNFRFKVLAEEYTITIPRSGNYYEMAPEVFKPEDGEYMLYDEENAVMYLPSITKVLFATQKYPDLEDNQLFAPIALVLDEDTVSIVGQVIEILSVRGV